MSSDPKPPKPLPSAEEINAYLEASAARTKKRLTLASGNARPVGEPAKVDTKVDRKLPLNRTAEKPGEKAAERAAGDADSAAGAAWKPFSNDDEH